MNSLVIVFSVIGTISCYESVSYDNSSLYQLENNKSAVERDAKFFPIFTIIRFPNNECTGTGSNVGTCFTRRECKSLSGLSTGSCASKRGVCCVIQLSCGGTTSVNNTYFTNPRYPTSYTSGGGCSITIERLNTDICQLRIDFLDLRLAPPNGDGVCVNDVLTVSGGSSNVPPICGENTGQHVYVNFDNGNSITLNVATSSAIAFSRRWNIRIRQLACSCPTLAPTGCLQFYNGPTGTIRSFNYGTAASQALSTQGLDGTRELANLNYGACVRTEAGYCAIRWSQTAETFSFTVTQDVIGQGQAVGTVQGALNGARCISDFVVIPNPINGAGAAVPADRFCGVGFVPVTTFSMPFVLTVVTNGDEGPLGAGNPPDLANRGFALNFAQVLC